jgi:hypothetical protein
MSKFMVEGLKRGRSVQFTYTDGLLESQPGIALELLKDQAGPQYAHPAWPSLPKPDLVTPVGFAVTALAYMDEGTGHVTGDVPTPDPLPIGALA